MELAVEFVGIDATNHCECSLALGLPKDNKNCLLKNTLKNAVSLMNEIQSSWRRFGCDDSAQFLEVLPCQEGSGRYEGNNTISFGYPKGKIDENPVQIGVRIRDLLFTIRPGIG